ncbi:IS5 family transposase [Kitasatospora sp. Ki12]
MSLTGGNRNDVTSCCPCSRRSPPWPATAQTGRPARRPGRRPDVLLADRGYDHDKYRRLVWKQGIKPVIARRGLPHGSGLGAHRWVVERTIAWLHGFRRLLTHRHVKRLC